MTTFLIKLLLVAAISQIVRVSVSLENEDQVSLFCVINRGCSIIMVVLVDSFLYLSQDYKVHEEYTYQHITVFNRHNGWLTK